MSLVTPRNVVALVVALYVLLGLVLIATMSAWETPDESDHVRNVEALVAGHMYRMVKGSGGEAVQPPLYYAVVAAWQRLWGVTARKPMPVDATSCQRLAFLGRRPACSLFRHDLPADGSDQRWISLLRLPGIAFGALTVLLTALAAKRLSADPWTPPVAAATVAFIPSFVFDSVGVSNDTLANALAAAATLLAIVAVGYRNAEGPQRKLLAVAMGCVLAALLQTKLTTLALVPAIVLAVGMSTRDRHEAGRLLVALGGAMLLVSAWWFVRNISLYGDPLALAATSRYNRQTGPLEYVGIDPLKQAFVTLPRMMWKSFWYRAQFDWPWWAYLPFWSIAGISLSGLWYGRRRLRGHACVVKVLGLFAGGSVAALWVLGIQDSAAQTRLVFIGLPAIVCLIALGLEGLRVPVTARFLLPGLGLLGTVIAARSDVLGVYL